MDQITIKIPNTKCSLYWCLIEFIDWRYSQSCRYFRPILWTSVPLTFSLNHFPPPLPCTVCNREGGSGCVEGMELYTVHLTIFRTYKIALPPKQKPRKESGLSQINSCRQVPLLVTLKSRHLGFGVFILVDIWSMPSPYRIPPTRPLWPEKAAWYLIYILSSSSREYWQKAPCSFIVLA